MCTDYYETIDIVYQKYTIIFCSLFAAEGRLFHLVKKTRDHNIPGADDPINSQHNGKSCLQIVDSFHNVSVYGVFAAWSRF